MNRPLPIITSTLVLGCSIAAWAGCTQPKAPTISQGGCTDWTELCVSPYIERCNACNPGGTVTANGSCDGGSALEYCTPGQVTYKYYKYANVRWNDYCNAPNYGNVTASACTADTTESSGTCPGGVASGACN